MKYEIDTNGNRVSFALEYIDNDNRYDCPLANIAANNMSPIPYHGAWLYFATKDGWPFAYYNADNIDRHEIEQAVAIAQKHFSAELSRLHALESDLANIAKARGK